MTEHEWYLVGPPEPAMEGAQALVQRFWFDADDEGEVRADLHRATGLSPEWIMTSLAALKSVLDDPSRAWALTHLVEVNANHSLDECTESAARSFLERFVRFTENVLRSYPSKQNGAQ